MRDLFKLLIFTLILSSTLLRASEIGTITIFTFYNGKALVDNEVVIDSQDSYRTDEDGSVVIFAEVGIHLIELYGKYGAKRNLGYAKKPVTVKEDQDTQIITTFNDDLIPDIEVDTPIESSNTKVDIDSLSTGRLNGEVISSETKKGIANARVFVRGTTIDARTDENGKFSVAIPADTKLSISVVHSEYSAQTINDIEVKKSAIVNSKIELTPASLELEEFVVLAPKVSGSITAIIAEEKAAASISNILSSEEMSKKGDSSAAGALKRVTGVTLVGGKSIYVRGLGDRYSNIEMNSLPLPSPNPLKRSVPLDIFPAGAIGSMKVQKSATADIPASFGGGYIDIRTKETSKEDYIKLSIGAKGNTNSGVMVDTYNGHKEIDPSILDATQISVGQPIKDFTTNDFTKEQLSEFTQKYVDRNYDVTKEAQAFGYDFGIEANKNIKIDDKHTLSVFANYTYETDSSSKQESYYKYDMQKSTGELYLKPSQSGTISQSVNEYVHNALVNIGYNYANVFEVKYTKLYTHNAEKVTKVVSGVMGSNDEDMSKYYLNWEERTLDVDQLNGKFDYELFGNESNIRFGLENAKAHLYQPNNYQYTFRNEGTPFLDNKISNNIANKLESTDDLFAFYLKNKFNFELVSDADYIDIGFSSSSKERVSRQNKYFLKKVAGSAIVSDYDMTGSIESIYDEYVRPDIAYDDRSLTVGTLFKPADRYDAKIKESSTYLSTFVKPLDNFELIIGLRYVDFSQEVQQYYLDDNLRIATQKENLGINKIYPSAGLKYKLDENNIFDIAYSQTYVVPDLREFTNGEYFHPYEVATIVGNPNLVNTDIMSIDLKYAHYFSEIDSIKFGTFYKYLDKPIEDVMIPSSSLPIYSFDNADFATIYGIEIDGRKSFDFIDKLVKEFYISGNFSYTSSEVTLRAEQESIYSTNHRELQGLSPIVLNTTFGYDAKSRSVTISYNKMGERIRKVGMVDDGDAFPDYYEVPADILDFVWIEKVKKDLSIKLKIGNILQGETIWKQGERITNSFINPMTFSGSMSYKW